MLHQIIIYQIDLKKKLFQKIYKMADKIIVNSNEFKKYLSKLLKLNPIVIYNPSFNKNYSI